MKKIFIFLFLILVNFINSQTVQGVLKDSLTKKVLVYSNVVLLNGGGTYSDVNGQFELEIKNSIYDTLKISSIGYQSIFIPLIKYKNRENIILNILLNTSIEELDEIVISNKKIKFKSKETLGEKKNGNIGMTSLIGYETCILIENPRNINGRIKRVYVDLKKRKNADYIATFNVKFYEYDVENNKPGKELYNNNIYIKPKNQKYRLWIDVKDFKIKFPESGICVGIELVNTFGKVKKHAYFGPMFRYTLSLNDKSITWSNFHNIGWKGGSNKHKKYKKYNTGISNPMIGLEVLFPSN